MDNACGLQGARQMTPSGEHGEGPCRWKGEAGEEAEKRVGEDAATGPEPRNAGASKPETAGRRILH